MRDTKTSASILSSLGLALLGTTCCALPTMLVLLGAGGAVASLVSALPWLATLSRHKSWVFGFTTLALAVSWLRLIRVAASCTIADAKRIRGQRIMLWCSTVLLTASMFMAFAAEPIARWLDRR